MKHKNLLRIILKIGLLLFLIAGCGPQATPTVPPSTGGIAFTTDRTQLQPGECTTLHWEVTEGFGVTLDGQPVDKTGQTEVCPTETRIYTLSVDMGTGIKTRQVKIMIGGSVELPKVATSTNGEEGTIIVAPPTPSATAEVGVIPHASEVKKATVTIDASQTGQPISPYLYGGFIEHQGRCIYGGVWAEMLEDRKFYYPVNYYFPWSMEKHKSPWHANEFDTIVVMDTDQPFVGEHTPRIDLDGEKPRGIVQKGLGLQQGKEYEGYIILRGSDSVQVEVSLVWGPRREDRQTVILNKLSNEYTKMPFRFTAGADTDDGRIEILGRGEGNFYVGTASLMPADNINGMRADAIALLKEIGFTIYRWPGGTFANRYHWREAIGDRDKRPPRMNMAYWSEDVESNDFGLDEFMAFLQVVDAEPYIVVSAIEEGDAQMAAEEVEYLNAPTESEMGALRAANGHPEPYNVRFWGIGNETWLVMPLAEYLDLHIQVANAMGMVDPTIQIIAVGGNGFEGLPEVGDWTKSMLTRAADYMNLISEHVYPPSSNNLVEHSQMIARSVRINAENLRNHREGLESLQGKDIRLVLDEWNYSWEDRAQIYGEAGPRYFFRDALGVATGLHEMFRQSEIIFMANTHPINVHGQVKTTKTAAAIEATGLVWELYRHRFGRLPVTVSSINAEPLDVIAAWNEDRTALTVAIVNPTSSGYTLTLDLKNAQLTGVGQLWVIAHSDPMAYNEPGQPMRVVIEEGSLSGISDELSVPPLSIILYELPAQ